MGTSSWEVLFIYIYINDILYECHQWWEILNGSTRYRGRCFTRINFSPYGLYHTSFFTRFLSFLVHLPRRHYLFLQISRTSVAYRRYLYQTHTHTNTYISCLHTGVFRVFSRRRVTIVSRTCNSSSSSDAAFSTMAISTHRSGESWNRVNQKYRRREGEWNDLLLPYQAWVRRRDVRARILPNSIGLFTDTATTTVTTHTFRRGRRRQTFLVSGRDVKNPNRSGWCFFNARAAPSYAFSVRLPSPSATKQYPANGYGGFRVPTCMVFAVGIYVRMHRAFASWIEYMWTRKHTHEYVLYRGV